MTAPISFATESNFDSWSDHLYLLVVMILSSILILVYIIALWKVIRGSKYSFIIVLELLLMASNLGYIGSTEYSHIAGH